MTTKLHRALLATFAIVLFPAAILPQQAPQKPPAAAPSKPAEAKPDYSQEPFIIEQFQTLVQFESDGAGRREQKVRIRVQSEAGVQQLGQLAFGYNSANERLEIASVEVRKGDGTVKVAAKDSIQDMTAPVARNAPVYTDYRQKHVTVPGLAPGETLSYHTIASIHIALAPGHFWFEHDFIKDAIVLDELLEVNVPRDRIVKLKTQRGAEPVVTEEGARRIYRWKSSYLQREDEDKDDAKPKKKAKKKYEFPAVQLTTFQSWEEVGRWYAPLERARATPDTAIRAKAAELVRGRSTQAEKLRALYDYVARNFRYVSLSFGVGRFQPHAASDILANQYGDCKDKHTLLEAMIEAIGLRAYPVLIHSSRKIDPEVPSPAQFDHMITAIPPGPGNKDWIWLDTTTEVAPFQMLAAGLRKKQALLIPVSPEEVPGGAASAAVRAPAESARLMETPGDLPFPATQRVDVEAQISELGKLTAHVRYALRGDAELLLRLAFRRTPQNQWKQIGQLVAASDGFRGEVSDVKASDPAATEEPFQVEYRVAQPNYLDWSSKKSQIGLPLPALGMPDAPNADEEADADTEPLELGTPLDISARVQLEVPAKYAARAPVPVAVMRDYAEYRSRYKVAANKITAERELHFKLREVPAARARDYLVFTRAVRSDEEQALALESTAAGTPSVPTTATAGELYEAGAAALQGGSFRAAAELFERVVALEPKHKSAWEQLGRAYSAQQQWPKAADAFRRQLVVDPYNAQANLFLGVALTQMQKFDEAGEAIRKQIELNPLDRQAHAALGGLYLEQRKYTDAVPELEKAVTLAPNNAGLQVALGQAYLNLNQNDRALAAFDKAVDLAPSPMVWNNIAYQLAERSVNLERAQQYAESAVAANSAALRNAALDRLTSEDLAHAAGLAAYWDTLGWVHFQKGNLDRAAKYIRAAWLLSQHGEVGDHLAQIYEKRGRKAEAVRTYAQALAANRPVQETRPRLAKLAGGEDKVEPLRQTAGAELSEMRTIKLGKLLKENVNAEFLVLLVPAADTGSAKAEEVKFVNGSEKLRPLGEALRSARYPDSFPDDTPTKIVRRGVLCCSALTGECIFVLLTPEQFTSVN